MLALRVLREIKRREGFSNKVLSRHLERNTQLSMRDRGFATSLVYAVLRNQTRIDTIIDRCARRPRKIKGELREILRLATVELVEMDHPLRVAAAEANKLLGTIDPQGALRSLITAVLVAIDRSHTAIDASLEAASTLDALEIRWSIPRWLAGRWIKTLGAERALNRARVVSCPPSIDLRIDLRRNNAVELACQLRTHHPNISIVLPPDQPQCLRTRGGSDLFYGPLHEEGRISVQSLGSQQAALALAPKPGQRVLDGCAGMGTKTLQLAELMDFRGTIVAVEPNEERLSCLEEHLYRAGAQPTLRLATVAADLQRRSPVLDPEPFDAILLDAPCTGLGNLGRHPEMRFTAQYSDIAACVAVQDSLIDACVPRIILGGRLLYAVCSLEPEEGLQRAEAALKRHPLRLDREEHWTPEANGCDGFYLALFTKIDA